MEKELGFRNAHAVEIQRVHRLSQRNNDTDARPIIAGLLRFKDVEEILGTFSNSDFCDGYGDRKSV